MRTTRSSSSDSDSSERVQNVRSVFIKYYPDGLQKNLDESYSYKRKLGDLIFDANFEGANLGLVERVDQYNYDLMVRPDLTNPRHRLWFNFTVSNQLPNQCVIFNLVNLSDYVRLFHDGLTPVARSRLKPNWVRLHEDQVFYYRSPSHAYRYVYSISFRFSLHDNEHQFALFYPYNYTTMSRFLDRWSLETKRKKLMNNERTFKSKQHSCPKNNRDVKPLASRRLANLRPLSRLSPDYYSNISMKQHASSYRKFNEDSANLRSSSSMSQYYGYSLRSSSPSPSATPTPTKFESATPSPRPLTPATTKPALNSHSYHRGHKLMLKNKTDAEDETNPIIDIQPIAKSFLNKDIYHVSIKSHQLLCDANSLGEETCSKLNVIILCRPAGNLDSACSFVCQGLIDYVMSDSLIAKMARRYINFDFFPMLDPDSVWVGNTRTDLFGQLSGSQRVVRRNANLYRGLLSVQDYILKLVSGEHQTQSRKKSDRKRLPKTKRNNMVNSSPIILIDLHVNISLIGSRVIGTYYNEPFRMERHLSFPRLLSQFSQDFYLENCEFLSPIESIPVGIFDFKERDLVDQYCFEISPFASFKRSLAERTYDEFTPEKYLALAKAVIYTCLELAKPKQISELRLHPELNDLLMAFHQGPTDIDDLRLNLGEFE